MKHSYFLKSLFSLLFFTTLIIAQAQPGLTMVSIDASCNGGNDGAASATVSGGTSPYTFLWSNTVSTSINNNLIAGTYTVTVTDNNGLSAVDSAIVNEPTAVVGVVTLDSNSTCFSSADGGATVNASGGTAPYAYIWSNSAITASVTGLMVGVYTVTITDGNGCTSTSNAIVNSNDNIPPTALAGDTTLFLDFNGLLTITGADLDSGSTDNCAISNFQVLNGNMDCNDIGANTVRLIAIDSDGNRDTAAATVTVLDSINPSIITKNHTVYLDASRTATIAASDVDSATTDACGIDSSWVDSNLVFNCSNAGANMVWLYAVDLNGNLDSASAMVTVIDTLTIDSLVETQFACNSYTWAVSGLTYTMSGTYNDTTLNPLGCDSIYHVLMLTIDTSIMITESFSECDSYMWRDSVVYTASNSTATYAIQNSNGCDSIVYNLNLTINNSDSSVFQSAAACGSYTWPQDNQTYTASGIYTDVLTNASGCDSTITLTLEIRALSLNVVNMGDSLFAFENHPQATYQWFDCRGDSLMPGATARGFKPDTTGFYSVIVGNGLCSDTSSCQEVINVGIHENSNTSDQLNVYPNPAANNFFFEVSSLGEDNELVIYDMKGDFILRKQISQNKTSIETSNWNAGIYFLNYNGVVKKIVINR